jgi:hypothetical protein
MPDKEKILNGENLPALSQSGNSSALVAAESAKARVQAAYQIAMYSPRDEDVARQKILDACKRPRFADAAIYAKPVGGTKIEGPSIRFAEEALRLWKNIFTDTNVIYEDDMVRRMKIVIVDLESNVTYGKEISIPKTVERKSGAGREILGSRKNTKGEKVYIVKSTADEMHNTQESLISKVVRNEGLRHIPADILEEALDKCKETSRKRDAEDPMSSIKAVQDIFYNKLGIDAHQLDEYVTLRFDTKLASLAGATETARAVEILKDVRGVYTALLSGDAKWSDYVPKENKAEADKTAEVTSEIEEKLGKGCKK